MAFGRKTPPAGFPALLGLASAWRTAGHVYGAMGWLGESLYGATSALFLAGLAGYLVKLARRPGVCVDDSRTLPGRAGLAAMTMALMLVAAGLMPYAPGLAKVILIISLLAHLGVMLVAIRVFAGMPPEGRRMTPVWHLTFVGPIVGAVGAAGAGWITLAYVILMTTGVLALSIYAGTLVGGAPAKTPTPLRPTLAIHLGPVSLFGLVFASLGLTGLAAAMGWVALVGCLVLSARVIWLTASGFSALWGAFTFPLSAFASLMLVLSDDNAVFRAAGLVGLLAATLIIPPIAVKVLQFWMKGTLAAATNAASA